MTAATEKKPDEVPPAVVDEEGDEDGEEDGAPETQGAGGKCSMIEVRVTYLILAAWIRRST